MTDLSTAQVDRLGERLRSSEVIGEDDLDLLQQFRAEHEDAIREVQLKVGDAFPHTAQTSRIKTVQTLHDKLRRQPTKLSRVQDIAGIRMVEDVGLLEQDEIVGELVRLFPGSKVVDRRKAPSHGYRAVHVIVRSGRCHVEIQVRTGTQDLWAQVVERLGDRWGRQIRYGDLPADPDRDLGAGVTRRRLWELLQRWAVIIASTEEAAATHNFAVRQGLLNDEPETNVGELKLEVHKELADLAELIERFENL